MTQKPRLTLDLNDTKLHATMRKLDEGELRLRWLEWDLFNFELSVFVVLGDNDQKKKSLFGIYIDRGVDLDSQKQLWLMAERCGQTWLLKLCFFINIDNEQKNYFDEIQKDTVANIIRKKCDAVFLDLRHLSEADKTRRDHLGCCYICQNYG